MSCTTRFLGVQWEHHHWRRQVSGTEVVVAQESDMWARPVYREYVRCDKRDVCETCGKVRREVSCICDVERGEACKLRRAWVAESRQPDARPVA